MNNSQQNIDELSLLADAMYEAALLIRNVYRGRQASDLINGLSLGGIEKVLSQEVQVATQTLVTSPVYKEIMTILEHYRRNVPAAGKLAELIYSMIPELKKENPGNLN